MEVVDDDRTVREDSTTCQGRVPAYTQKGSAAACTPTVADLDADLPADGLLG